MKKLTIISDVICFIGVLFILVSRIQDSEIWFKTIMAIIVIVSLIRLIYDIKKSKNN